MMMVLIQSEKCHNDGVSRPPIRDNDLICVSNGKAHHTCLHFLYDTLDVRVNVK